MSMSTEEQWESVAASKTDRGEIVGPALGAVIAAIAVSGLLDDSRILVHPWWFVLLCAAGLVGLGLGARTIKALLQL